jgi:transposase-like protein
MTKKRRSYTATEKADAVRMQLADKKPVSEIAELMQENTQAKKDKGEP